MMIEKVIRDYLAAALDPVPVYLERPSDLPKKYVFIEKTGSRRSNFINTSTFAFQSYDETMYKASSLNEAVKDALFDIVTLSDICASNLNSDYPFPSADRKEYRYQAVFDITHY